MSADSPAVRQAKEIADKFRDRPEEKAAAAVAAQIRMFWIPTMVAQLRVAQAQGRIDDPLVVRALALLGD
ncbi:MAG TPA: formate dehydrogenase subunit delta [Sporichthya sp.]|nr:formate dehydrogenase subunit delta [Sporichthya sp.]